MSGQIQIATLDQDSLYKSFYNEELKQADDYYLFEKFRIGKGEDKLKTLHTSLYKDMLCTDNCEIIKFINKQVIGGLTNEKIKIVDLKVIDTEYRDINNYYYNQPFSWQEDTW
jgi:hypothetical protein